MEMNTRIQVEHTVTEMVTGIDIVAEQIRSAAGLPLSIRQEDIRLAGNAIECRICAEDPFAGFDPRPGTISLFRAPQGDGIRTDHAIGHGFGVSPMFDSMVAKVITWGPDRKASLEKMRSALKRMVIHGIDSNAAFLRETLNHPVFIGTGFNTSFIASHSPEILQSVTAGKREPPDEVVDLASHLLAGGRPSGPPESRSGLLSPWSTIGYWRIATGQAVEYQGRTIRRISAGGKRKPNGSIVCSTHPDRTVWISLDGHTWQFANPSLTRNPVRKEAGTEEFSQAQPARPAGSGR